MKKKPLPTMAELSKLLRYEPDTGRLFWRECSEKSADWNSRLAGKEALTYVNSRGYKCGGISRTNYKAHRIIWRLIHGDEPESIDHINGNQLDNRIENLRSVSHTSNMRNQKRRCTNTTGVAGVMFSKSRFRVCIGGGHNRQWIGSFESLEDATAAKLQAERQMGFHENHGR